MLQRKHDLEDGLTFKPYVSERSTRLSERSRSRDGAGSENFSSGNDSISSSHGVPNLVHDRLFKERAVLDRERA